MLDYQRIADDVRSSLYTVTPDGVDFLRASAADYSVACDEVNERLRECGALLRQGLRSDAIRLCETEPNLLDLVAVLDFPEREPWDDLLSHYGLASPAPLMMDVAADLNEAYAVEQPMEALLRRHRLLAMARSPLRLRIQTLRKLAELDGNNPIWREDVQVLEKQRHEQIQWEVAGAARDNLATMTELHQELHGTQWQQSPPAALVRQCEEVYDDLSQKQAVAELEQTAVELNEALASRDVERGRRLREVWDELAFVWGLLVDEELIERPSAAREWLRRHDEQDRYEQEFASAVASLEQALDDDLPLVDLEELYDAAPRPGHELPPDLEDRYESRITALRRASRWRTAWKVSRITLAAVVVLGLLAAVVEYRFYLSEVALQDGKITKLLTRDVGEAKEYCDELERESPRVWWHATLQERIAEVEMAWQEELVRRREFKDAIDSGHDAVDSPSLGKLAEALKYLQEARRWAETAKGTRGPAETAKQGTAIRKLESDIKAEQGNINKDFVDRMKTEWAPKVDTIHQDMNIKAPLQELEELAQKIGQLIADLTEFQERSREGEVSEKLEQLVDLISRLQQYRGEVQKGIDQDKFETHITDIVGSPRPVAEYASQLEEYTKKHLGSNRTKHFEKALEEKTLWEGLQAWNELITEWNTLAGEWNKLGDGERAKGVVDLRKKCADFVTSAQPVLDEYKGYPNTPDFSGRLDHLKVIETRVKEEVPIQKKMIDVFDNPWHKGPLGVVVMNTPGQRYYVDPEDFRSSELQRTDRIVLNCWVDFGVPKQTLIKTPLTIDRKRTLRNAPHCALVKSILKQVSELNDANWESSFAEMINEIWDDPGADPIVKVTILLKTLEVGRSGSLYLGKEFAKPLEDLEDKLPPNLARLNWLDPDDRIHAIRLRVGQVLKGFPADKFRDAGKSAVEKSKELFKEVTPEYVRVGWLYKGRDGTWWCGPKSGPEEESGQLCVLLKGDDDPGPEFFPVGVVSQQGIRSIGQTKEKDGLLCEGRPLYLAESNPGANP